VLRVGLTGGIGSGKSTASHIFESLGVPVIDTDLIAREVVAPGTPGLSAVLRDFGTDVVNAQGLLNRNYLREKVFVDPMARERLEEILHPLIRSEMRRRVSMAKGSYCILAIPLLIEKGWQTEVDRILVIDTEREVQIARAQQRDGLSQEQVERILATQSSREERLADADDVITNNGDINTLREQVTMAHGRYLALAR
jgi:dephospho-CoA kinase